MRSGASDRWRERGDAEDGSGTRSGGNTNRRGRGPDPYARQNTRGGGGGGTLWTSNESSPEPPKRPKSAADVDREARAASEQLKRLLSSHPPWSKDVESSRQRARNAYLTLLFAHPLSTYAQSLDALWLNTSYALISAYRASITRAEDNFPSHKKNPMGDPEFRKVMTRFRQALASEESFFRNLVGRIVHFYQLQDIARPYLAAQPLRFSLQPSSEGGAGGHGNGSDHHGLAPISQDEAREKIALVYKALICLGDIERYKDQYSDRARRERDAVRGKQTDEMYAKAKDYYEVARALLPEDGSAFNQLAVISTYAGDDFQTNYYYYRALAVRSAFKNGEDILGKFLKKLSDRYSVQQDGDGVDEVDAWKREFLMCVSSLYRASGLSQVEKLQTKAAVKLEALLAERKLPSEVIVKLIAVAIGTHWHARATSSISAGDARANSHLPDTESASKRRSAEEAALAFVLTTMGTLLSVAASEVESVDTESAVADDDETLELHVHITAVLRRILPSLRIGSKWLKLHLDYMTRFSGQVSAAAAPAAASRIAVFWTQYHRFIRAISHIFPLLKLPHLVHPLEEDRDMRGFLPLSRGMSAPGDSTGESAAQEEIEAVHPNEEQLMRLADLQVDATLILQTQTAAAGFSLLATRAGFTETREEDIASVSTETEEDPVNMAMRATLTDGSSTDAEEYKQNLDDDEEEEEEIIVWGRAAQTPVVDSFVQQQPGQTGLGRLAGDGPLQHAPTSAPLPVGSPGRHLGPIGGSRGSPQMTHSRRPSGRNSMSGTGEQPSGGLLFGGDTGGIWRMTREESEKGQKRADIAAAAEAQKKQQDAIKALWSEAPTPKPTAQPVGHSVPPPPAPSAPPSAQYMSMPGTVTSQHFPSPGGYQTPTAPSGNWSAGSNDAASLLAGLTSGAAWMPAAPPAPAHSQVAQSPGSPAGWQGFGQTQAHGYPTHMQQPPAHLQQQQQGQPYAYRSHGGYHPG